MTKEFYDELAQELFYGSLPHWQKTPVDKLIEEGQRRKRSLPEIAYILATGYWETGRWKYDEEIGKGRGRDYSESVLLIRGARRQYHGRGDAQLTWLQNYARASIDLTLEFGRPINLVEHPDLAKLPEYSSLILWMGSVRGTFTGKNLADYFSGDEPDYVGARRIINGTNKARKIADIAVKFAEILERHGVVK